MAALLISLAFPAIALVFSAWLVYWIMKHEQGTSEMKKVAESIREGAGAFLKRQYRAIGLIGILVA